MENTIQILKQTSDGLVFDTKKLFNILDSIGDKNIAIVSPIGKQRTGKSLLLNYLLRFLKFNESSYLVFRANESVPLRLDLRVGDESQANGIWMCSKPFIVTAEDGSDVALFLMETRCETKASSQQSGIIFAISLLLSSTSIINIKNDLSEDVLQFVEYFARFAQSLIGEAKTELFQRLVFLVRDWDNECAYRFGYHSEYTFDVNNYKKKMLNPNHNHCDAEQRTRKSLLSLFGDISSYLMPHPGKNVTNPTFCGQIDFIDKDFAGKVEEFAHLIIGKLEPITIGGRKVSAISLRNYFTKWQKKFGIEKSETMSLCPVLVEDKHETMALCPVSDINDDEVEFIQAINYYETISCFAKIDGQSESYSQKPNNIVYVELPCPASYNGMCETNEQYWYCFQCKECLEYGFDGYFYCECGRAGVNSFEFKCNSKNHSSNYLKFKEIQLKLLLSNKEVNILILGETGVGKSTWINGFVNYLTYPSLAEAKKHPLLSLIASSFTMTDNNYQRREINCGHDTNEVFTTGQSATQDPKAYVFDNNTKLIRIIDTPGIGDTRGIDQDKKNFDAILRYLSNLDKLHGICILLKPNNARLGVMFRFCIKELLIHLHRDASRNIVFCFTNARSTFYRPGDTMPALETLLRENQEVEIKLSKDTIYCMDNEPFRFLCALHNGIEFDEEERTNYSKSWDKSVSETKRMVDYICKLTPHAISNISK